MLIRTLVRVCTAMVMTVFSAAGVLADPCGMVPPIYNGQGPPITRIGLQKTYVFYKDGVETFVIRPGFSGKVDEFGMLIPFPAVPAIRKAADDIFSHVANAIDPPEVVIDLRVQLFALGGRARKASEGKTEESLAVLKRDEVRVLKEEAIGMYEVAVLGTGSAEALKKWMDQHGYHYPDGMDKVTEEYVELQWCFVAVKTKVGEKSGVDPQPGQRSVDPQLEKGATFDGFVQAMGFRFETDELVVPMRLSSFNPGDLHNVVYIMTEGPRKIRRIPEEYVVRQISGEQLLKNMADPLPLRIIGGTEKDLQPYHKQNLQQQRDPKPKNGLAKELFAADLMAVSSGELSLPHEEDEKELLRIGERFGLRGPAIDRENAAALAEKANQTTEKSIQELEKMTLTVVDGDFPREVLAKQNLTFAEYRMPADRNNPASYEANTFGPGEAKEGVLIKTSLLESADEAQYATSSSRGILAISTCGVSLCLFGTLFVLRRKKAGRCAALLIAAAIFLAASQLVAEEEEGDSPSASGSTEELIEKLGLGKTAEEAIEGLVERAKDEKNRDEIIKRLYNIATKDENMVRRGWAIAALSEIGGLDVDEKLIAIHNAENQSMLVRTWAAAARVSMVKSPAALVEKASLIATFPSLGRPIGMRLLEQMREEGSEVTVEQMITLSSKTPELQTALIPPILAAGAEKLAQTMVTAGDLNVRRQAAAYLGTLAQQDANDVAKAVIAVYKLNPMAEAVPWKDGPLYVPGIQWDKENGTQLAGNLIAWNVWCEEHEQTAEQQQIYNNLCSIGLANVVGYQILGDSSATNWLSSWAKVVGKEKVKEMLDEMKLSDKEKYKKLIGSL